MPHVCAVPSPAVWLGLPWTAEKPRNNNKLCQKHSILAGQKLPILGSNLSVMSQAVGEPVFSVNFPVADFWTPQQYSLINSLWAVQKP